MKTIRVLLADDHTIVRSGLRMLVNSFENVEVVGEADDGLQVLALARQLAPDVILIDIAMPNLNGIETTSQLARECPDARVIILSVHATPGYVSHAIRAGASGYLLKDAEPAELEMALQAVVCGKTYLTPAVSAGVVEDYLKLLSASDGYDTSPDPYLLLTNRQREILQLVAEGKTTNQISQMLSIAPRTVEAHRRQIRERLGIETTAGLIRYALKVGLVSED